MMYKHRNMDDCLKKQIFVINIVHLLEKYNKILQNA